jgi:sigma-54 dependent transcriptional regulator, flagellar regulatory protein
MYQTARKPDMPNTDEPGLIHAPQSPLVEIRRTCVRIAASDATVLLTGETGTGKEVFARLVHAHSARSNRQFVPVNCGAIPETLLESELFGYVRGAFTGAVASRKGRVALAEGGTLFLDEIGELPLSLQVKLLRLLQEKSYEPVGSSESVSANFRLIAATNRDLLEEVRAGRFRRDLYYRLHVCPVRLPALRERRGDIAPLFMHFWRRRGDVRPLAPEVMRVLETYSWPGNVRELENLVERVSVCAEGKIIQLSDLPPSLRGEPDPLDFGQGDLTDPFASELMGVMAEHNMRAPAVAMPGSLPVVVPTPPPVSMTSMTPPPEPMFPGSSPFVEIPAAADITQELFSGDPSVVTLVPVSPEVNAQTLNLPVDLPRMLRDLENAYINKALTQTGGNKKEAAKLLGMGRTTLVEKLRRRAADAAAG